MNTKDFERRLAFWSDWSESEIDQRIRPLRDGGVFGRGAGRHAPDLTPLQAALMLLQMVPRRATDAAVIGRQAWDLKAVIPPNAPEWAIEVLAYARLPEVMSVCFDLPDSVAIHSLRVQSNAAAAWMVLRRGDEICEVWFTSWDERRTWVEAHPETYHNQGTTFVGQCFYMGHGTFEEIALGLKTAKQSGWVGEKVSA